MNRKTTATGMVVLAILLLSAAPLLLVAADEHETMTELEPGAQHWYTLAYPGSGTVDVAVDVSPPGGAAFMIVTADAIRAWEAGEELEAIGQGAENTYEEADLFWSGDLGQAGDFYLVVEYTGDGSAPSSYVLEVGGAQVTTDVAAAGAVAADGTWCYAPGPPNPKDFEFGYKIGENDFFAASYLSDWTGTFTGASHDNGFVIWRNFPADGPAMFVDLITFDAVKVGGKTGGLELYLYGERETNFWTGSWFIAGASGELEGLAGRGKWWQWQGDSDGGCAEGLIPVHYSVDELRASGLDDG